MPRGIKDVPSFCKKSTKDGAIAIATDRRGYNNVQGFRRGYSDIQGFRHGYSDG